MPSYKPAYIYGGPIFSVSILCENLASHNSRVTFYTTTANGEEELPAQKIDVLGVTVHYFPRIMKGHKNLSPLLLKRIWREAENFDIVHIHSWWNLVAIPAAFLCLLKGIKPVVSPRGTMSDYTFTLNNNSFKGLFHRFIGKNILKKCVLHLTTQKEKLEAARKIDIKQSVVIPNFIKIEDQYLKKQKENEIFTFVTLSRLHPVKNFEFIFSVLSELVDDFRLVIIGEGEQEYVEKLKKQATLLNITQKISWLGQQNSLKKYHILQEADLFLQLSLTENFGNAVIEAASCGTPVLVADTVGAAALVDKLNLGWITPLQKQQAVNTIKKIITEKSIRRQIRRQAPNKVREYFSDDNLTQKYQDFYKKLVQS